MSGVVNSMQPLPALLAWAAAHEPHPPLSYAVLHLWMAAAGSGAFAARYLSVVVGTLTVALFYQLLRQMVSARRALIGTALLAASGFHVYYSQEARMHILACLFGVGATLALLMALARPNLWRWTAYCLLAAANLYTFYFTALVLLAINLPVLLDARRRTRCWWLANATAIAAWLPWLGAVYLSTSRFVGEPRPVVGGAPLATTLRVLTAWAFGIAADVRVSAAAAVVLALAVLACGVRLLRGKLPHSMLVLWSVLPLLGIYAATAVAVGVPDTQPRLELMSLPAWIAVVVVGWPSSWRLPRPAVALITAGLGVFGGLALASNYTVQTRDDYRALFALVGRESLGHEALIYDAPEQEPAVRYYFPSGKLDSYGLPQATTREGSDAETAAVAANHDGAWAVLYGESQPWVESWLDGHLIALSDQWFGPYVRLKRYAPAPLPAGRDLAGGTRVEKAFGPLELSQIRAAGEPTSAGMPLELLWRAKMPVQSDYHRSLQLFNEQGRRVAQLDSEPFEGGLPTSRWSPGLAYVEPLMLRPEESLTSGAYTLKVAVYETSGPVGSLQPVLRVPVQAAKQAISLDARSSAGWVVEGVDLSPGEPGEQLAAIRGSVRSTPSRTYTWFAHVLDGQQRVVAQDDHPPIAPTTAWRPGDAIRDVFRLALTGPARSLELGAYDASGARASFTLPDGSTADHLTLTLPDWPSS